MSEIWTSRKSMVPLPVSEVSPGHGGRIWRCGLPQWCEVAQSGVCAVAGFPLSGGDRTVNGRTVGSCLVVRVGVFDLFECATHQPVVSQLYTHIKAFATKLQLFRKHWSQRDPDTAHFPTLQEVKWENMQQRSHLSAEFNMMTGFCHHWEGHDCHHWEGHAPFPVSLLCGSQWCPTVEWVTQPKPAAISCEVLSTAG